MISACSRCGSKTLMCIVTAGRRFPAEYDDEGVIVIVPEDLLSPDWVDVEIECTDCAHSSTLARREWSPE